MATFKIKTKLDKPNLKLVLVRGIFYVILYIIVALVLNLIITNGNLVLISILAAPLILMFPIIKILESIRLLYQPDEMEYKVVNDVIYYQNRFIKYKVPLCDIIEIIDLPKDFHYRLGKKNFMDYKFKAEIPKVGYSNPFGIIMKKDVKYFFFNHERSIDKLVICDDEKQLLKNYIKKRYNIFSVYSPPREGKFICR